MLCRRMQIHNAKCRYTMPNADKQYQMLICNANFFSTIDKILATHLPYSSLEICDSLMYLCTQPHNFINMSTLPLKDQLDYYHPINSSKIYSK